MKIEQGAKVRGLRLWKDVQLLASKDTRPDFEEYERTSNRSKTTPAAVRYST
jgi:capsid protein